MKKNKIAVCLMLTALTILLTACTSLTDFRMPSQINKETKKNDTTGEYTTVVTIEPETVPDEKLVVVPDFSGYRPEQLTNYEKYPFRFVTQISESFTDIITKGVILEQEPAPGTRIAEGSTVLLKLSTGKRIRKMPDYTGCEYDEVCEYLNSEGYAVIKGYKHNQEPKNSGKIAETIPPAGEKVYDRDIITLILYRDCQEPVKEIDLDEIAEKVIIPEEEAETILTNENIDEILAKKRENRRY